MRSSKVRNRGLVAGYRSGLEEKIATSLHNRGVLDTKYEQHSIAYTAPSSTHKYTPDFTLPNGIIIESKGRFMPDDRAKHMLVKAQFPNLDIRFVFSRSKAPLYKGSPTSYADWCEKNGFKYADKDVPDNWLKEAPNGTR